VGRDAEAPESSSRFIGTHARRSARDKRESSGWKLAELETE
jgi:hypothetical protein